MLTKDDEAREWEAVQALSLSPGVDSYPEYLARVTAGETRAARIALQEPEEIPVAETIQRLHQVVFDQVYPWAGHFNAPGEEVGFRGTLACDPRFILPELTRLGDHTRALVEEFTDVASARAIAFYHAKFERIHPFRDGNARVARVLIEMQMNALFGVNEARASLPPDEYREAMQKAQRDSNLFALMDLILRVNDRPGPPGHFEPVPFRLRPYGGTVAEKMERRRRAKDKS